MNKQDQNKIDWTDWTWNPISGCLHGCDYCYMRRMEKRFKDIMVPKFVPKRLQEPLQIQAGVKIFAGSSGDMWGDWVDRSWIECVFDIVHCTRRHTYQFLTKNPKRYSQFEMPDNCWIGTTVDGTDNTKGNIDALRAAGNGGTIRFISFEPLLRCIDPDLTGIDWVIIGANSNKGAVMPPDIWADLIIEKARAAGSAVWIKNNLHFQGTRKEWPRTEAA